MRITIHFLLVTLYLCVSVPAQDRASHLPDPKLTPGHALDVTAADLCKAGYENPAHTISIALKGKVFDRYGTGRPDLGYNIDHLIPASLGGSNQIANLWPQPLSAEWSWHKKNTLERRLRKLVCRGQLDLKKAQQEIATDWVSAYKKYVGDPVQKRT
jgi:hypothetical protein